MKKGQKKPQEKQQQQQQQEQQQQQQQYQNKPRNNQFIYFLIIMIVGLCVSFYLYLQIQILKESLQKAQDSNNSYILQNIKEEPKTQQENKNENKQQNIQQEKKLHPLLLQNDQNDKYVEGKDYRVGLYKEMNIFKLTSRKKSKVHPLYKKFSKIRLNEDVDQQWKGKEEIAEKVAKYFQKFNDKKHQELYFYKKFNTSLDTILNEQDYCIRSDTYHILHPESIFDNYLIFSTYRNAYVNRECVKDYGVDLVPNLGNKFNSTEKMKFVHQIPIETTLIFVKKQYFHNYHLINVHQACTYQSFNQIPGEYSTTGKDTMINFQREYIKKEFKNKEQCPSMMDYMPPSYRLFDEQECTQFFNILKTKEYAKLMKKEGVVYILKEGRHMMQGDGVNIITEDLQKDLMKMFNNGDYCNPKEQAKHKISTFQVQKYIGNPIVLKQRKVELRVYTMVASTDPFIIWVDKNPLLKKCGMAYDKFNPSKFSHVCNLSQSKKITDDFIVDFSLEGLQDILLHEGLIDNPKWAEEVILPQIYGHITHLFRAGKSTMFQDSRLHHLYAVDLIVDQDDKVWILENNFMPGLTKFSVKTAIRHQKMFGDYFEIAYAYYRSRIKRVNKVAADMREAILNGTFDETTFKKQFDEANKNFLEKEFEPKHLQSFVKTYDETLPGKEKFMGNLPEGCLYKDEI